MTTKETQIVVPGLLLLKQLQKVNILLCFKVITFFASAFDDLGIDADQREIKALLINQFKVKTISLFILLKNVSNLIGNCVSQALLLTT